MKRYYFISLLIVCMAIGLNAQSAKSGKYSADYTLSNSPEGMDFWLAAPPNLSQIANDSNVCFYISAVKDSKVAIVNPNKSVTHLTIDAGTTACYRPINSEIYDYSLPVAKSFHITSNLPISIFVLNDKNNSSDGYLALPTIYWGNDYRNLSFCDNGIDSLGNGFVVLGNNSDNYVHIAYKNLGDSGTTFNMPLDNIDGANAVVKLYDGSADIEQSAGKYSSMDMSGTKISSIYPVGVISYHRGAACSKNQKPNYLCEMIPPTQSCGNKYYTISSKQNDKNLVDYFRAVAFEDSTMITIKTYDSAVGRPYSTFNYILYKAGDVFSFADTESVSLSKRGNNSPIYWSSSKPFMLSQYSYGNSSDSLKRLNGPFMTIVPPVNQYVKMARFVAPAGAKSIINISAEVDNNDPISQIKTIKLDDAPIYTLCPTFINNCLPHTNTYWTQVEVEPGAHKLIGNVKFGAVEISSNSDPLYGWPIAMSLNNLAANDTMPPIVEILSDNTIVSGDDTAKNSNTGISKVVKIDKNEYTGETISYNFSEANILYPSDYSTNQSMPIVRFNFTILDSSKPAKVVFGVLDRAGNYSVDSIVYEPTSAVNIDDHSDNVVISPNPITTNFLNLKFDDTAELLSYEIFGQNGETLIKSANGEINSHSIDISKLSQGAYFIKLNFETKSIIKQFSIIR